MNFYDRMQEYRDRTLFVTEQRGNWTYGQACALADRMLADVPSGSVVFLFCRNCPEAIAGYLGMLKRKIIPVLLDPSLPTERKKDLADRYKPDYCLYPEEMELFLYNRKTLWKEGGYVLVKTAYENHTAPHPDLALLLPTSGSTGSPKLVRLSSRNLQSNAEAIAQYLEITENDRPITSLPMQYTYGLSVINSHVYKGAALLLTDETVFDQSFWDFMKKEHASSIAGVPRTYEMLKMLRMEKMELPDLKVMTQAGGHLPEHLQQYYGTWCMQKNVRFYIMYGQTEATARMSYLPWKRIREKTGSIGLPIPGGRFELTDENGHVIEGADQEGELIYYGKNVSLGYARRRQDLATGDENNGCLHTGDMARRDSEGYYYITGRKKRFLKVFGIRVSLDMLEEIFSSKYPDCDAACTGRDDHIDLFIEKDREDLPADQAVDYLSAQTRLHPSAFHIHFISSIPRNASGKIRYDQLKTEETD